MLGLLGLQPRKLGRLRVKDFLTISWGGLRFEAQEL